MFNLEQAVIFDIETFPNCFTVCAESMHQDDNYVWEISDYQDDSASLFEWLQYLAYNKIPMIGFNNVHFDYPVIHEFINNPNKKAPQLYDKAMSIINNYSQKFQNTIWANERYINQIDLFKMYHFDNRAKTTSLKALQINMRSDNVVDMPIEVGTHLTKQQIDELLIPYNRHDVKQTKKFAELSKKAIDFRFNQIEKFGVDVMNWPDTKIGSKILENRLGKDACYDYSSGSRKMRQSPRSEIALADVIFPCVQFENVEFNRVLNYLKNQTLKSQEIGEIGSGNTIIKTKGVFNDLKAHVGGIDFHFGTGGIHGSLSSKRIESNDEWLIRDIDVASLYPSIAIVNNLAPEHLGQKFVQEYANLPKERKEWQKKLGKKCVEANSLKLASNGTYGNSNSVYSIFYDPKFTMTITINGQLLLCMLAEKILKVQSLKLIQINTDGITYLIHKDDVEQVKQIEAEWEKLTNLVLEDAYYNRMWIRDVNSYIAEDTDGNLKQKGAYWCPDALNYNDSITECQPPAWHKDLGNLVSIRAAIAYMVQNIPVELFIKNCTNPYDFLCRVKIKRSDRLVCNNEDVQKTSRYYISNNGHILQKIAPPIGPEGQYKRANGVTEAEYDKVMKEVNYEWDERVCTKNKSKYESRTSNIQAGYNVRIANDIRDFNFDDINYDWYISEAMKLIIQ